MPNGDRQRQRRSGLQNERRRISDDQTEPERPGLRIGQRSRVRDDVRAEERSAPVARRGRAREDFLVREKSRPLGAALDARDIGGSPPEMRNGSGCSTASPGGNARSSVRSGDCPGSSTDRSPALQAASERAAQMRTRRPMDPRSFIPSWFSSSSCRLRGGGSTFPRSAAARSGGSAPAGLSGRRGRQGQ